MVHSVHGDLKMKSNVSNLKKSEEELLLQILQALKSIRYGYIQIIVQDSKVVQIDKTEKIRFDKEDSYRLEGGGSQKR